MRRKGAVIIGTVVVEEVVEEEGEGGDMKAEEDGEEVINNHVGVGDMNRKIVSNSIE